MTLQRVSMAAIAALLVASAASAQTGEATRTSEAAPAAPSSATATPSTAGGLPTVTVPPGGFTPDTAKGFFTQYCITCHNQYAKIGDMVLDTRNFEHIPADAEIWERVVRKLNAGAMPPQGMPRPEPHVYKSMVAWLTTSLDGASASNPNPGRASIHRLNRTEYGNASATCSTWRSTRPSSCRPTTRATASTTSPACCACRRRCSSST